MLRDAGGEATFVKTDVARAGDVEALIHTAVDTYGRLDCAHNNAGIEGVTAMIADYSEADFDRYVASKHAVAAMTKAVALEYAKAAFASTPSALG